MRVGRFARHIQFATIGAVVFMSALSSRAQAQDGHTHSMASEHRELTPEQKRQASELVRAVRQATQQFQHVENAGPDYALIFGCVSGGDFGAMGMHFLNGSLMGDGDLDVMHPEILLYEPLPNGKLQLTGADYIVDAAEWDANPKHKGHPPELMGQLLHYFDSPNRFGLKPFYTLHVWAWKDNPNGTFANWNPNVSCDAFNGPSN
jgi:hypothetical protein